VLQESVVLGKQVRERRGRNRKEEEEVFEERKKET
jgi:hypothetical protein